MQIPVIIQIVFEKSLDLEDVLAFEMQQQWAHTRCHAHALKPAHNLAGLPWCSTSGQGAARGSSCMHDMASCMMYIV
jgi:hypothetical protein